MCEYPPSTAAGAPIIVKQLLRGYDLSRLDVLCCEAQHTQASEVVRNSYLPCRHTLVRNHERVKLRPRRVFVPLADSLNCIRVYENLKKARALVRERSIEALFTVPWRCEFALAAYLLHRETGLPLYVFETDDWEEMNRRLLPAALTRQYHAPLLRAAEQLWLTSPAMVRSYRERFGVDGEFLFHFVDPRRYAEARPSFREPGSEGDLVLVYTGAINIMFEDTLREFCGLLNSGLAVDGRRVRLKIYTTKCPPELLGPNVTWEGFVSSDEIPDVLASGDILLVCVSFSEDPAIVQLVKTSLYTKTIDYLAAGKPVLVVSPPYSGEVDYFRDATHVVTTTDRSALWSAVRTLSTDDSYTTALARRGHKLVARRHSLDCLEGIFLRHFRAA